MPDQYVSRAWNSYSIWIYYIIILYCHYFSDSNNHTKTYRTLHAAPPERNKSQIYFIVARVYVRSRTRLQMVFPEPYKYNMNWLQKKKKKWPMEEGFVTHELEYVHVIPICMKWSLSAFFLSTHNSFYPWWSLVIIYIYIRIAAIDGAQWLWRCVWSRKIIYRSIIRYTPCQFPGNAYCSGGGSHLNYRFIKTR